MTRSAQQHDKRFGQTLLFSTLLLHSPPRLLKTMTRKIPTRKMKKNRVRSNLAATRQWKVSTAPYGLKHAPPQMVARSENSPEMVRWLSGSATIVLHQRHCGVLALISFCRAPHDVFLTPTDVCLTA